MWFNIVGEDSKTQVTTGYCSPRFDIEGSQLNLVGHTAYNPSWQIETGGLLKSCHGGTLVHYKSWLDMSQVWISQITTAEKVSYIYA